MLDEPDRPPAGTTLADTAWSQPTQQLPRPWPDHAIGSAIRQLSSGNVVAAGPRGPQLLRRRLGRRRKLRPDSLVPLLSTVDRLLVAGLTAGWAVCLVLFWGWWLQPSHRVSWVGLAVNSALLLYLSGLPVYFLVAANRLRHVDPATAMPRLRVAFAVTRAPSEPWSMARTTLSAMLDQDFGFGYDVWLCDEDPSGEIADWCRTNGVYVSTRRHASQYHRSAWPRRTRCKEGNLAHFYDHWGYPHYDVVAQLDCDHVPARSYLAEMVRPFADPAVGYVCAPSVCDSNAGNSWSARSRLYREASFHGPFQAGHTDGLAPVCIGSHYAVRTEALRDIGGLGPELAEDFTTTFLLNSAGWQGVFALNAEAHGEGPHTFAAMVTQEFQWSRSLTTVLYDLLPVHWPRLPWRLRLRFLVALLYYPLLAATTVAGLALPPVAAVTGLPWINVNYFEFLARWWALAAWLLLLNLLLRRRGVLRPPDAPVLSWELWLGALTRWPFVAWGVLAATLQKLRPRSVDFRVTPKAHNGLEPLPTGLVAPFAALSAVLSCAALVGQVSTNAAGYVFLCLLGAASYAAVALSVCVLHAKETAQAATVGLRSALRATVGTPLVISASTLAPLAFALALYPDYAIRTFGW